jgi:hypothetical protein
MLTIFTTPKPFKGHISIIQKNAITSWTRLKPRCEVILIGDDEGVGETASEIGVQHISRVEKSEFETPLLSSVFDSAAKAAKNDILVYVNSDIILLNDFVCAVKRAHTRRPFLMTGRRWDLNVDEPLDFSGKDWDYKLRTRAKKEGKLRHVEYTDYFAALRNFWFGMPPFIVGRPAWDNFMIFRARKRHYSVIDATYATTVIHQNHDYHHVPKARGKSWEGPEGDHNRRLAGKREHLFTLLDATHIMGQNRIFPPLKPRYIRRRLETLPVFYPGLKAFSGLLEKMGKILCHVAGQSES